MTKELVVTHSQKPHYHPPLLRVEGHGKHLQKPTQWAFPDEIGGRYQLLGREIPEIKLPDFYSYPIKVAASGRRIVPSRDDATKIYIVDTVQIVNHKIHDIASEHNLAKLIDESWRL